ncbi:uncharacterized protein LOC118287394 isoform X1 [Scophthalmus maximus]|uniref:uncharacterized protein LOC118287394 isoform X1 n=1 Tax=Scophthalmus maximus TaxID=52904 RepID=UPI0015E133B6|nr:uncharacterized protein LOC118287394 isoform X1 [Scophthalmus maximus]
MANFQLYQFNPESDTNREEEQAGSPDAFQPRLEQDGSEWFSEERIRTPFLSAAGLEPNCLNLYTLQNGLRTSEVQNRRTGRHRAILRICQEFPDPADQYVGFRPPLD